MTNTIEIARTIQAQIPARERMAIGATKFVAMNATDKRMGGLMFSASLFGRKNCHVAVELNHADLYNITVTTRAGKVLERQADVYAEDMGPEVILACERYFAS
jgi:hypothetical protein